MKQKITIDSVIVNNSYVRYSEYDLKSDLPGSVFFDRFHLSLYNLSNYQTDLDPAAALKIKVNTYVMGEALMNAEIVFPYGEPMNSFWMKASSEPLDFTILNPLTENALGITIRSGKGYVEESFITGSDDYSKGTMIFRYKKMKLGLYNRNKAQQNKGMIAGVARFLINDILINTSITKSI